ncbi:50S ribosomal protein L15 [candidate division KSB1 bacterium]|nr:50S ribosomal protein L15 [candidate division KSB1 bacterium]
MDLGNLKQSEGATKKTKRVGRGQGSGHGKTSCRGSNGQLSRSGSKKRSWFEGGQMPLQRRVPKRGFTNIFRKHYEVVNVSDLSRIPKTKITIEDLKAARLVQKKDGLVKILGEGELKKAYEVEAHAFSKTALEKINAAGGKAISI